MTRFDFLATEPHYRDHLLPVWDALREEERGGFNRRTRADVTVVASVGDYNLTTGPVIRFEHGIGLSYRGVVNPAYAGGRGHGRCLGFPSPNRYAADRWLETYPDRPAPVVGVPRLDRWLRRPRKPYTDPPTVAVSFHWDCRVVPETRWAFPHFVGAVAELARADRLQVIGHAHPRARVELKSFYRRHGIEWVPHFADVLDRADVYVCDNSSTLYEFAATDRPVVVLNPPWYRRGVEHGLRFWEHADVGVNCDDPAQLVPAVRRALTDPPDVRAARRAATEAVFPVRGDATLHAVRALRDLAERV